MQSITKEELDRALIDRHSYKVHQKLSNGHVAIAGLGGLGSNIAFSLARIGVGYLHLVDFDKVDITNLNRQQYFIEHLGMYKTDALKQELLRINPYLHIRTDCVRVDETNIETLFSEDDILCEAFDQPEAKAMFITTALSVFPDKPIVCGSGMAGYHSSNSIHTRKVAENWYLCGDETSCISEGQGLMAPRVAICAAHEANMVTRLLLDETEI